MHNIVNITVEKSDFLSLWPLFGNNDISISQYCNNNENNGSVSLGFLNCTPNMHVIFGGYLIEHKRFVQSNIKIKNILQELDQAPKDTLGNFLHTMKKTLEKEEEIYALASHQYNDAAPIFACPENPLMPAFISKEIIYLSGYEAFIANESLKNNVLQQINQHLNMHPQERAVWLDSITEVRDITQQDCIADHLPDVMIGQRGVFARHDLPENFFLGFYSGLYFDDESEISEYVKSISVKAFETYLFGFAHQACPIISGYLHGNRITIVNSVTNYIGDVDTIAARIFYGQNTVSVSLKTKDNPNNDIRSNAKTFDISGYVTIQPVKAGEQLYVDYGYQYWQHKNVNFIQPSSYDIKEAIAKLKKSSNHKK